MQSREIYDKVFPKLACINVYDGTAKSLNGTIFAKKRKNSFSPLPRVRIFHCVFLFSFEQFEYKSAVGGKYRSENIYITLKTVVFDGPYR